MGKFTLTGLAWAPRRHPGGRRRHLARQFYAVRSRVYRSGRENSAAPRKPLRAKSVTYVLGTICYLCLRSGQARVWLPIHDSNSMQTHPFIIARHSRVCTRAVRSWFSPAKQTSPQRADLLRKVRHEMYGLKSALTAGWPLFFGSPRPTQIRTLEWNFSWSNFLHGVNQDRIFGDAFVRKGISSSDRSGLKHAQFSGEPSSNLRCVSWLPKQYIETENRRPTDEPISMTPILPRWF